MSFPPSLSRLTQPQTADNSVRSEEHIDDVDARSPRQDVLIHPWSSYHRQQNSPPAELSHALPRPTSVNASVIQPIRNNFTTNLGQDVRPPLSDAARSPFAPSPFYQDAQPRQHLESTPLPSSSAHPHHHALNPPSAGLRTSLPVFGTTSELAAHYGIPRKLPPTPRVNSVNNFKPPVPRFNETIPPPSEPSSSTHNPNDFLHNLMSEYMTMLSNKDDENAPSSEVSQSPAAAPLTMEPSNEEAAKALRSVLFGGGDYMSSPNIWDEYLTSPLIDDESPFESLLETPAQGSVLGDFFTSPAVADFNSNDPFFNDPPLFQSLPYTESASDSSKATAPSMHPQSALLSTPNFDSMLTMSPATPMLDPPSTEASPMISDAPKQTPQTSRSKKAPTGTRKNITPDALVPLDAPTQTRNYVAPSATSRKEVPAVFARKRARSTAFADEEDELAEEADVRITPSMSEAEAIAAKRRQNTLAARRSRKRKLEYQQQLEDELQAEKQEKEAWRQRAIMCKAQLVQLGFPEPFKDDA